MKIVIVGGATQDIFIQYDDAHTLQLTHTGYKESYLLLKSDSKINVKGIIYTTGGGATNTAVAFTRLGFEAHPWISIGNDIGAQAILHELQGNQVIIDLYEQTSKPTGTSFIIPSAEHTQSILVFRGANEELGTNQTITQRAYEQLHNSQLLYISSLTGNATHIIPSLLTYAKKHNLPVACNPSSSQLQSGPAWIVPLLSMIDIFIVNVHEADLCMNTLSNEKHLLPATIPLRITNAPELLQEGVTLGESNQSLFSFFSFIHQQGPAIVVVTNGEEGVYVSDRTHIYFHPSICVPVISTVGAGDAFNATFVAYLLKEQSIKKALTAGIVNAGNVIQHIGAKTGLLYKEELETAMQKLTSKIKIF